jgi:hypothetical protein
LSGRVITKSDVVGWTGSALRSSFCRRACDLAVALGADLLARRLVARDLGIEALDFGDDALLLEADGALQLAVGVLQQCVAGALDVGRELEPEIDAGQTELELLVGAGQLGARLVGPGVQRPLHGGDLAARIDRSGAVDGRARAVQVLAKRDGTRAAYSACRT